MLLQLDQSYEHDTPHAPDNENAQWIRRKNYAGLLSGCAGTSFCPGAHDNPLYTFKHWRTLMDTTGMVEASHLFALFESRPWHTLQPDRYHRAIVSGHGELESIDYVASALTADGGTLIAYVPDQRVIGVDLSKLSGFWATAWWFDPRTGRAHFAGLHRTHSIHDFDSPAGDWVLVLDDASLRLRPPGVQQGRTPIR
jgi:Putative collagen-binding domain of a collagenase